MSAGEISQGVGGWDFILESENEGSGSAEGWSEEEQSHGVTIVGDGVSPSDDFIEAVEENSEEA